MGHKVSPVGMRVGIIRDWESRWYAEKDYGDLLIEDVKIRDYLFKKCRDASVSRIEIERSKNRVEIIIRTARPGVIIGTNGENINSLIKEVTKLCGGKQVHVKAVEVANPDLDATLVAESIASQLEQRASFRTAQKKAIQRSMRSGAKGIKTLVSGRLGGADIARSEGYNEGVVPLHTLRADIDFAKAEAKTTYGRLGVKVWICRGEVKRGEMVKEPEAPKFAPRDRRYGGRRDDRNRGMRRAGAPQAGMSRAPANTPEAIAAVKAEVTQAPAAAKDGE